MTDTFDTAELKRLTIEPHGDGHAVYSGREQGDYDPGDGSFFAGSHGNRLFNVSDATEAGLQVAHEMVAAVNALPGLLAVVDAAKDLLAVPTESFGVLGARALLREAIEKVEGRSK